MTPCALALLSLGVAALPLLPMAVGQLMRLALGVPLPDIMAITPVEGLSRGPALLYDLLLCGWMLFFTVPLGCAGLFVSLIWTGLRAL
jgi:hypothetical protein